MVKTEPRPSMPSKEQRKSWRRPFVRVAAILMRRSSPLEDSSSSCTTQDTMKSCCEIDSPVKEVKSRIQEADAESTPASQQKSKKEKGEKLSKKGKSTKSGKKKKEEITSSTNSPKKRKVKKSSNLPAVNASEDVDRLEETTDTKRAKKSNTPKKKKKTKKGERDTKDKKKLVTDETKKKKKKKKATTTKAKEVLVDIERVQPCDEDTSIYSCGSFSLDTCPRSGLGVTSSPLEVSTRAEDSSIHSTASSIKSSRLSRRSSMSATVSALKLTSIEELTSKLSQSLPVLFFSDDFSHHTGQGDPKPASSGTLDSFIQSHQSCFDPFETEKVRGQSSQSWERHTDASGSLDLDDIFPVASSNDGTTISTVSSVDRFWGNSSNRSSRRTSPGRMGARRKALITDWTAPVDANRHWSSCHEPRSLDLLSLADNSFHGSASVTPICVSKSTSRTNSSDHSKKVIKCSDHDVSTCGGEEFADDMFDSDIEEENLSDEELKNSPGIPNTKKPLYRNLSETSFDAFCLDDERAAFGETEQGSTVPLPFNEVFEILQMTPRTQNKFITNREKFALVAAAVPALNDSHHSKGSARKSRKAS